MYYDRHQQIIPYQVPEMCVVEVHQRTEARPDWAIRDQEMRYLRRSTEVSLSEVRSNCYNEEAVR
jgi:hypothetical protein